MPLLSKMSSIARTRGLPGIIRWTKDQRTALLIYLSGEYPSKKVDGVRVTSDGIPVSLGPLVEKIRKIQSPEHFDVLRVVLTILFSTRALNIGKIPDTSSITSTTIVADDGLRTINDLIRKYLKDF